MELKFVSLLNLTDDCNNLSCCESGSGGCNTCQSGCEGGTEECDGE